MLLVTRLFEHLPGTLAGLLHLLLDDLLDLLLDLRHDGLQGMCEICLRHLPGAISGARLLLCHWLLRTQGLFPS